MQRFLLLLSAILTLGTAASAQLLSPSDFLPHEHGRQFTPHHMVTDYFRHVAANSPNVLLTQYGNTNEGRPLLLAFISSPENLARLDDIRQNNLRHTGILDGETDPALDRAIVWLSCGVHGNEAGGTESALSTLYELVRPDNKQAQEWMQNTIILLDPSINPDGFSRYTNWYRQVAPRWADPEEDTYEHDEPWPGGRTNHYFFDLNRDWAWQTQVETQQRIPVYHQWMPHIHVDYHEQYPDNPYYFAPAASPYHEYITNWQADFQYEIGKNNARYFDKEGWLYFTREDFDLLYPSYGDTYPTFNGAIGMTYEQAGHGIAGRAYLMENGDTLTLQDRIAHHTATALSTVEMASKNADRLIENFEAYFSQARNNPIGKYKAFIIRGDNARGKLKAFCALLDKNDIRYGRAGKEISLRAFHYQSGTEKSLLVKPGDLVISTYQPLSVLAQALLEPEPSLEDTLTYDITAWSLPYAYGLEAYATKQQLEPASDFDFSAYSNNLATVEAPYAYLAEWSSFQSARFLGALLQKGVKARYATGTFSIEGQEYQPGTLVITAADNRKLDQAWFHETVGSLARKYEAPITAVGTGFSDSGFDLGSASMSFLQKPKIALLFGEGAYSSSAGELWHFFEQQLEYPVHLFEAKNLSRIPLEDYNLIILPEGQYNLNEETLSELNQWMSQGGRLIAIGGALGSFEDKNGFNLSRNTIPDEETEAYSSNDKDEIGQRLQPYAGQSRRYISLDIPGAIFKVKLDNTHPLAFGLGKEYYTLKTGSRFYKLLKDSWNVGYIGDRPEVIGFAGFKAKENNRNSVVFALEPKGRGAAIFLVDNPLFRGFWENGKLLFSNAVFLAGQ
ncbi:MAG: zinc carboxypeptidase [Phaeodactylibacter sp.]|nr:zinc carboxypeptidase [Phaeodactylibacter sp.]MCB9299684.1 zinc carboxypeptidase [Lewinellaceae bacterium]HQU57776.1 M14 family zinc carboxypeptidase [Saprospiraceae bacterium]